MLLSSYSAPLGPLLLFQAGSLAPLPPASAQTSQGDPATLSLDSSPVSPVPWHNQAKSELASSQVSERGEVPRAASQVDGGPEAGGHIMERAKGETIQVMNCFSKDTGTPPHSLRKAKPLGKQERTHVGGGERRGSPGQEGQSQSLRASRHTLGRGRGLGSSGIHLKCSCPFDQGFCCSLSSDTQTEMCERASSVLSCL